MKAEWADGEMCSRRCMERALHVELFWTFLLDLLLMLKIETVWSVGRLRRLGAVLWSELYHLPWWSRVDFDRVGSYWFLAYLACWFRRMGDYLFILKKEIVKAKEFVCKYSLSWKCYASVICKNNEYMTRYHDMKLTTDCNNPARWQILFSCSKLNDAHRT